MALEGELLGVELNDLWHAGKIGMPRIAEAYVEANRTLASTSNHEGAFSRGYGGEYGGGSSSGKVMGPWTQHRNTIQTVLGNTANNVVEAGTVLVHIADSYASNDGAAATRLQQEWNNRVIDPTDPRDRPLDGNLPAPVFP